MGCLVVTLLHCRFTLTVLKQLHLLSLAQFVLLPHGLLSLSIAAR